MTGEKIPCSVGMLTRNSGKTLRRALESVEDFAEIILCDGGSTDDTLEIAKEFGARIIAQRREYLDENGRLFDYGEARNQCLDMSMYDWFLFVDSDEYCGEDLVAAIRTVAEKRKEGAFWVNRTYTRGGAIIDCATTYPNRQMRLFAKRSAKRFIKKMHEKIELREGVVPEILGGTLYVPFDMTIEELREKWAYQTAVEVARLGSLTPGRFLKAVFDFAKVSLLYALRSLRILLFCKGVRMPFLFEIERHKHHMHLIVAFWKIVKFR